MTLEAYVSAAYQMSLTQFNAQIETLAQRYVKRDLLTYSLLEKFPELKIADDSYENEAKALYDELKANGEYTGTYEDFVTYNDKYDILISLYSRRILSYFTDNATVTDWSKY